MGDRDVARVVGEAGGVESGRLIEILEDLSDLAVGRIRIPAVNTSDIGERDWERELRVENVGEIRNLVGPDVSAKESEDAGHRGLPLVGRAEQVIEKAAVSQATSRIADLPFGVVEVVVCAQTVKVDFCVAGLSFRFRSIRSKTRTPCRLKTSPSHIGRSTFHASPSALRMRLVCPSTGPISNMPSKLTGTPIKAGHGLPASRNCARAARTPSPPRECPIMPT